MLYIPSLWYHAATQTTPTIAINLWTEMTFDQNWVYYQYLRDILR